MKYLSLALVLVLGMSFMTPNPTHAAKQLTQPFSGTSETTVYFDLPNHSARILHNGIFYASETPKKSVNWEQTNNTFLRNGIIDSDYTITTPKAVSFKGYDYFALSETENDNHEIWTTSKEIWRMNRLQPELLERVKYTEQDNLEYRTYEQLFRFRKYLYAVDSEGLLRTKNGHTWNRVTTRGLPTNEELLDVVVSNNTLYASTVSAMYSSTNGKTWSKISGSYKKNASAITKLAAVDGQLFAVVRNQHDTEQIWKRTQRGNWKKVGKAYEHISSLHGNTMLTFSTMHGDQYTIRTYNPTSKRIRKRHTANGRVISSFSIKNRTAHLVDTNTEVYLLRSK